MRILLLVAFLAASSHPDERTTNGFARFPLPG